MHSSPSPPSPTTPLRYLKWSLGDASLVVRCTIDAAIKLGDSTQLVAVHALNEFDPKWSGAPAGAAELLLLFCCGCGAFGWAVRASLRPRWAEPRRVHSLGSARRHAVPPRLSVYAP